MTTTAKKAVKATTKQTKTATKKAPLVLPLLSLEFPDTAWDEKHSSGHKEAIIHKTGPQFCEVYAIALVLTKHNQKLISPKGNTVDLKAIIEKGDKRTGKAFVEYKRYYVELLDNLIRKDYSEVTPVSCYQNQADNGLQILSFCRFIQNIGYTQT